MINITRYPQNPILSPDKNNNWEAQAVFNGSIAKDKEIFYFVYRAVSRQRYYYDHNISISSIGCAQTKDGINFYNRKLFISPEYEYEQFGCEDPRVTKLGNKYYIFYTAISQYPPNAGDIKIAVAITPDFQKISEKHLVTHFNSKAMALFPEKINGKIASILTIDTDKPPSKIALAFFDNEKQIWSQKYWIDWQDSIKDNLLPLQRDNADQIEVGAPPLKTDDGWLVIYSYIKNYLKPPPVFGIEAVLLDLKNPSKIIGRTKGPLLVPEKIYELYGQVPNVIFPSGACLHNNKLRIYYGAADTTCCLAETNLKDLIKEMKVEKKQVLITQKQVRLEKYKNNPIIEPIKDHNWENKYTFNPAAVYEKGKVHIIYRAMGEENVSVLGYASSPDGVNIDKRLDKPIYIPREIFEKKVHSPADSGCEDPRITKIKDRFYMCYTAYDGKNPWNIMLTSIKVKDFINKKWNWAEAKRISCPTRSDKNACVMPEKIKGKYVFFHRIGGCIWVDQEDNLYFGENSWLGGRIIMCPRINNWDSNRIGIAGPPIKTPRGWLLIYHGHSRYDDKYRLGAMLLDLDNPARIISILDYPILEPEESYENKGLRPGTVFSCGAVVIKGKLFVYYGAADQTVAVAFISLDKLLKAFVLFSAFPS